MTAVDKYEKYILPTILVGAILFAGVGLFVNAGRSCDTQVDFIVVGNFSQINGTIPELQFSCVEMCSEQFNNDFQKLKLCYEQCVGVLE